MTHRDDPGPGRAPRTLPLLLASALLGAGLLVLAGSSPVLAQDDGFGPPPPPKASGPRIEFDQDNFDWGEVMHGETIEHVFKVRNTGTETLRITNVKPG